MVDQERLTNWAVSVAWKQTVIFLEVKLKHIWNYRKCSFFNASLPISYSTQITCTYQIYILKLSQFYPTFSNILFLKRETYICQVNSFEKHFSEELCLQVTYLKKMHHPPSWWVLFLLNWINELFRTRVESEGNRWFV
jgi:hypothetical protein